MTRPVRRALLVALLVLGVAPASARAEFGIVPGSFTASTLDVHGNPDSRAGIHPDRLVMSFGLSTDAGGADGNLKDFAIDLPRGVIGDPAAVPACPEATFMTGGCGLESQVGIVTPTFAGGPSPVPVYSLTPGPNAAAVLGFNVIILPVRLVASVRPGDSSISIEASDIVQDFPLLATQIELWGVPAAHQTGTTIPRLPFLTTPTRCDQDSPMAALHVRSWQQPGVWLSASTPASPPTTGCQSLPFAPRLGFGLDHALADTPTGAHLELQIPQATDVGAPATSHMRSVAVTLPEGMSLSPGSADGLTECSDEALGLGTSDDPNCPPSATLGTVELESPLLRTPAQGRLYLGRALPGDRYRLLIAARSPGLNLKLTGSLRPDPDTGRLTAILNDLPELPFSRMSLNFKDGPRAPLVTSLECGVGTATAVFTPYSGGATVTSSTSVAVGGAPACPAPVPFAPQFTAGSSPARAGGHGVFSLTVRRPAGGPLLDRLSVTLPPGLAARLGSVPRCSEAAVAADGACPAASRIGSLAVEMGSGPNPFGLPGAVYLTGPYRRAPFGVVLVFHALAGPFDLGPVVIRGTLRVDRTDGHLSVETDPFPRMREGIPLRLQTLGMDIDRPGFVINPTSCAPMKVAAAIRSTGEAMAHPTSPFAVGQCRALQFRPAVQVSLTDTRQLRRGGHPGLRLTIHRSAGQANLRSADVRLPSQLTLDQGAVTALCSREQARDVRCPSESRVGTARARTPLLADPMVGSIYAVQPRGDGLPDLWASLDGTGVHLDLRSEVARRDGRVRTEFVGLPDLPISEFALRFTSGEHGVLAATRTLCAGRKARRLTAAAALQGQNGARRSVRVQVASRPRCSK